MKVISLDRELPEVWLLAPAVEAIRRGELVVIPTDSVYALACASDNRKAASQLYAAKRMDPTKRCSVICADLKDVGSVARAVSNEAFRFLRQHLPGPYTVLLHASRDLPKVVTGKRKGIGVRIPDHPVSQAVVEDVGAPILVTSLPAGEPGELIDPVQVAERLYVRPSVVVDQGPLAAEPSTVVDFSCDPPELIRQGRGELVWFDG